MIFSAKKNVAQKVNLNNSSIATLSFKKARTGILTMIGAICLGLLLLVAQFNYFKNEIAITSQQEKAIDFHTAELISLDKLMTTTAILIAHTGDQKWVYQYENAFVRMTEVVKILNAIIPKDQLKTHHENIKAANDSLEAMEHRAIQFAENKKFTEAQKLLNSPSYKHNKQLLANDTQNFVVSERTRIDAELEIIKFKAKLYEATSAIAVLFIIFCIWQQILRNMHKNETLFNTRESKIRQSAHFDNLTGLPNRGFLFKMLTNFIENATEQKQELAALVIDLDHFKPINDTHGHLVGDGVLKEVASRMQSVFGENAFCSRLGGDEFVCILNDANDIENIKALTKEFIDQASSPIFTSGVSVQIGASVGCAFCPTQAIDPDGLIHLADLALYHAKENGRGNVSFYDLSMNESMDINPNKLHSRGAKGKVKDRKNKTNHPRMADLDLQLV